MAPKPKAPETPAPKPTFDWSTLLPAEASASRSVAVVTKVNVLEDTNPAIRERAEQSLALSCSRIDKAKAEGKKLENLDPAWRIQPVATLEMGEEFAKILRRYGKYRPVPEPPATLIPFQGFYPGGPNGEPVGTGTPNGQVTVRVGSPAWFRRDDSGNLVPVKEGERKPSDILAVRYVVKPLEVKATKTLPGVVK